ncbi:hypothetical protein XFUD_02040 [Xylella fastidiosa]|uniref:Uncharacterized protein n=1 Tax=Xylella fastidiosa (strain 9a5c) TaxID=160492 RepID=Q9PG12_XYLFA|nr:hypothetical protein [Xylella fastidiosa]AAF83300.1 hypothetical protein XF_0490 [Xylella fastidiosa 9a5c]ALQ94133.1 hypothetical protein XFUD_02040 [Xylella fastidiosa]NRP55010.1 hypothetical protein [Xylella fastidiosa]OCA58647.1 hypothetical protein AA93_02040 [Xylella fastidiosa subsp. pauca 11399]
MTAPTHFIDLSHFPAFQQCITRAFELAAQALPQASPSEQKEFTMTFSKEEPRTSRDFSTGIDQQTLSLSISHFNLVTAQLITNPQNPKVVAQSTGYASAYYDATPQVYKDGLIIGLTHYTVTPEPLKAITAWLHENNIRVETCGGGKAT